MFHVALYTFLLTQNQECNFPNSGRHWYWWILHTHTHTHTLSLSVSLPANNKKQSVSKERGLLWYWSKPLESTDSLSELWEYSVLILSLCVLKYRILDSTIIFHFKTLETISKSIILFCFLGWGRRASTDFHLVKEQNNPGIGDWQFTRPANVWGTITTKSQSLPTGLADPNKMGSLWLCISNSSKTRWP